ncbi:putative metal-dependent hydrolase [Lentinula raphanica]|nr:putative metal-dependent hydrolase [Lentinula raphanica]
MSKPTNEPEPKPLPPIITLEEHYISSSLLARKAIDDLTFNYVLPKLSNIDEERIKDMDAGSVTLQVLSHVAIETLSPELARETNDELHTALQQLSQTHPGSGPRRLAAFANLPMADPPAAAAELTRTTTDLGFVGALINNHLSGRFYDDSFFWPVFERAQELDVPIYIHPMFPTPSKETKERYEGNYSDVAGYFLGMAGWGWHADTGLHMLRLWASGVWDRFPRLKVVIGHMGELIPFQLDRIVPMSERWGEHKRGLREVWRENIWVTTSGMFSLAPMACLLHASPADHIMFSVDYPFSSNETGKKFLEELRDSELVNEEEFEGIAFKNAERLLKVKV